MSAAERSQSPMNHGVVIVGGGHGGFQTALSLRTEGYADPITIVGEEAASPYQRPPLSKGILLGKQQARHAILRPASFYEKHSITLVTGDRIESLNRQNRRVTGASGRDYSYDALVLATGARNRILPLKGRDLEGVCYLRTLGEAENLHQRIDSAEKVVVIGGGFIGLEVAAAARTRGKNVTVLEAQSRLMERAAVPEISKYFLELHREQGVRVLLRASAELIAGSGGKVTEVVLSDGGRIPADVVVIGIGVVPNAELAADAGLATHNGVVVDKFLQTEDTKIFAIGDCAEYPNPFGETGEDEGGARVRLESVQNAVDQAVCVARAITGNPEPYRSVPWFWTHQFHANLQIVGIASGVTKTITRGNPSGGKFSLFHYRGAKLCAVDSINSPLEHTEARKLIDQGAELSPAQAADQGFDLKSILQ